MKKKEEKKEEAGKEGKELDREIKRGERGGKREREKGGGEKEGVPVGERKPHQWPGRWYCDAEKGIFYLLRRQIK